MTWFTATSVAVNNGQTVVSVNAGDDIQLAQESGGLIIGNNPPVEIKRSYLDGSNNKKIELRSAWPYANQAAQPAVAFPTDGDLAAATAVLKQLIDGFALATQAQAEQGTNNTAAMTALRVKQAIDFFRPLTTSANDTTAGRLLQVGAGGVQLGSDVYRRNNILGTVSQSGGIPTGAIIQRGSNANGEFARFADGTQICWMTRLLTATELSNNNVGLYGWSYYFSNLTIGYPIAFISAPSVVAAPSGAFLSVGVSGVSASACVIFPVTTVTTPTGADCHIIVIGRWF